jgi:Ribbon-helix-helix protein, copG family
MTAALNQERSPNVVRSPTKHDTEASGIEVRTPNAKIVAEGAGGVRKKKITISLSEKSVRAFEELKCATDADTDSEVFRNALRLHLTLLRAYKSGVKLFMKRDNSEEVVPVTLFAESEGQP